MQKTIDIMQSQVSSNRASLLRRNTPSGKAMAGQESRSPMTRWVGRTDSGRPAPHIFESGRPRTGVWSSENGKRWCSEGL